MPDSLLYVLLSAISIQGAHSYLLFSQKHDRKWTISDHAILNRYTRFIYFFGHLIGGFFLLLMIDSLFTGTSRYIFYFAVVVVILEYAQAIVPSDPHRVFTPHSLLAYSMWIGCISLAVLGLVNLDLSAELRLIATALILLIIGLFIFMHFMREKIYLLQYITIYLFFAVWTIYSLA